MEEPGAKSKNMEEPNAKSKKMEELSAKSKKAEEPNANFLEELRKLSAEVQRLNYETFLVSEKISFAKIKIVKKVKPSEILQMCYYVKKS